VSFRHLARWLESQGITAFHSTPGVFRNVMEYVTTCPELRLVRLEGDRALPNDVKAYAQKCGDSCILVNGLGATECGLVRQYFIGKETTVTGDLVPVGYAVEDFEVQLVPEDHEGPGSGQAGEITFKSAYLARGYWKNEALTGSRFLPDAVAQKSRLYLTGDRGHMSADGCLLLIGRTRGDVNILGQTVELGEVEAALAALPSIVEVTVVANNDKEDQTRLIAYYVAAQGEHPSNKTLRQDLEEVLPRFMVPSLFIKLDAFPLTVGGKLDYEALPSPGSERPVTDRQYVSPRTPMEESLATIWEEVLGLDRVGVHDDFRDLGGNSLMAGQVISRVIQEFRVELPLRSLMEAPTIADMVLLIVGNQAGEMSPEDLEKMLQELERLRD
jgi:acyl-coenzyme A synthetase/AMP-(fatty) acid ligase/acyl carrier protein